MIIHETLIDERTDVFIVIMGLAFLSFGILGNIAMAKTKVLVFEDRIVYKEVWKKKVYFFKSIDSFYIDKIYIVLDVGKKNPELIPLYFEKSGALVSLLRKNTSAP